MPATTINRERTIGQQRSTVHGQMYQDMLDDEAMAARQVHDLALQYNQDLLNGVTRANQGIEAIVLSMALEQEVDLSQFSRASTGDPQSNCETLSNEAGQQQQSGSAGINQTQLLSGSRS